MAMNGIKITNNFDETKLQFLKLIRDINEVCKNPIQLSLNVNQIQEQLKQVTVQAEQFKSAMNTSMGSSGSSSGLDKMIITTRSMKDEVSALSAQVVKVSSNMGETVQITEKFKTALDGVILSENQIGETVTKTTSDYKSQNLEAEKLASTMGTMREKMALDRVTNENKAFNKEIADEKALEETKILRMGETSLAQQKQAEKEANIQKESLRLYEEDEQKKEIIANKSYESKMKQEQEWQVQLERDAIIREQESAQQVNNSVNQGESALVQRENTLLAESTSLLNEKYSLEKQIIIANKEGNIPLEQELILRREAVALNLQEANSNLSNASEEVKATLLQRELELKNSISLTNTKIEGQEQIETAEIQRRIALFERQKDLQVQSLQKQYGSNVDTASLEKVIQEYKTLGSTGAVSLSELNAKEQQVNMTLKEITASADKASGGLMGSLSHNTEAMITWTVAATAIFSTLHAIQQGITDIIELDNTINDLKMDMMSTSDQAFGGLIASSRQLSIQIGANTSDIDEMMKVYANANITIDEIMAKTKPAAILNNITDMSATESVDAIQAILMQFDQFKKSSDDVATQATHVTDVLASVGQSLNVNFKTGVSSISEAVKVSGSVINEAGISYEKYASIVGKVAEIQRISGSTIGNAMKTIASRISRANTGDASADDISKTEVAYRSIGISVRDASGNFNDLDQTLTSLSSVWGSLNSVQRSYIAEQSAGVR